MYKMNEMSISEQKIINAAISAYIQVYGLKKWQSLTDRDQHDVIMIMMTNFYNAI